MASVGNVVLITGVGRYLGARLAARLSDDPAIERIIGVDTVPPRQGFAALGRAEFVRADVRHPLIGKVLDQARVDTVLHPGVAQLGVADREHLLGTVSLLAACGRSRTLSRLVAASTTSVYGASPRDPAVFTEDMGPVTDLRHGPAREAAEIESHLRAFARHAPDISVGVLRLATVAGPTVDNWFTRYLAAPVVATSCGFDPRLQFVHEYDAVEALIQVARGGHRGAVNVAGEGVLTLTQVLRIAGRLRLPVVAPALAAARVAGRDFRPLLQFGRVVDTTRLTTEVGYVPRYTSAEAIYTFADARPGLSGLTGLAVGALAGAQRVLRIPA